ncbi:MAG TPA: ABC transporter ATP-binding protein [Ramlibacter sp.]|nr:ABC transporter ATP-binding protein [Ramlibacter sp.]
MLEVKDVSAGYGSNEVLFGVSMTVEDGEFVTLMGRNGMGKTTLVRTLMGLLPRSGGHIRFDGQSLDRLPAHRIARLGLGLVPEGRLVCANLTVRENLVATERPAAGNGASAWNLEKVYALFPRLAERQSNLGSQLSGGELQLLAIGRALMMNPRLLILDEATEGLAPLIREIVWNCLQVLRSQRLSVLLIDKNVDVLSRIADRHIVLERGRVVWSGDSKAFIEARSGLEQYLGV